MGEVKKITFTEEELSELEAKVEAFKEKIDLGLESLYEHQIKAYEDGEYNYLVGEGDVNEDRIELTEDLQKLVDLNILTKEEVINNSIHQGNIEVEYQTMASPFQYGGPRDNEVIVHHAMEIEDQIEYEPTFDLPVSLKSKISSKKEFRDVLGYHVGQIDYADQYYDLYFGGKEYVYVYYNTDYDIVRFILTDDLIDDYQEQILEAEKVGDVEYVLVDTLTEEIHGRSHEKRDLDFACNMGGDIKCRNCGEPWDRKEVVDEVELFNQVELTQPSDDPHGLTFIQLKAVGSCPSCD